MKKDFQQLMQEFVSSLLILERNLRNWHWHIKGPHFAEWHEFYGAEYKWVAEQIDLFAERMRYFDYRVELDGQGASVHARSTTYLEKESIEQCLEDYRRINAVGGLLMKESDAITEDMLEGFLTTLQEKIWHISSHNSDGGY